MFPTPAQMLGVPKFSSWYPGQEDIFQQLVEWMQSDSRFACAPIPTGFGKSLLGMLTARWGNTRTAYVTSTKGLQDQLMRDFNGIELREIMGRNSYVCNEYPTFYTDKAPCTTGLQCPAKDTCLYFSALDVARQASLVSTNYAYWLNQHGHSDGISDSFGGQFGLLILDEGHVAAKALESYMKVSLDVTEIEKMDTDLHCDSPWQEWRQAANICSRALYDEWKDLEKEVQGYGGDAPPPLVKDYRFVRDLFTKVQRIMTSKVDWVPEQGDDGVDFTPIEPKDYNKELFLTVPKILILSAVMTERAAQELGVDDPTWITAGSPFPPENAPFTHLKTIRVDYKWTEQMKRQWVSKIDSIIRTRLDRKGIIHTGSYARVDIIKEYSQYRDRILTHKTRNTIEVVNDFKRAKEGTILASPSVTTGWDFPGKECEYIIWGKVPYPFSNTPLAKARKEVDKSYGDWEAMKSLVQGAGRGNRREEDKCEVFIIDDHWGHFWRNNKEFAPAWFQERVTGSKDMIPEPLDVA
jgi:ATP-dependent DNA helicase DinG